MTTKKEISFYWRKKEKTKRIKSSIIEFGNLNLKKLKFKNNFLFKLISIIAKNKLINC